MKNIRISRTSLVAVVAVVAVTSFTLGHSAKADGVAFAWGSNDFGQLGIRQTPPEDISAPRLVSSIGAVKAIEAGCNFTLALKSDGTVWAFGKNTDGELGDGTETKIDSAPYGRSMPKPVIGLKDIVTVAASSGDFENGLALKRDGTLWSWGSNHGGKLGDGGTVDRDRPVLLKGIKDVKAIAVGWHSLAIKKDGSVWAWGGSDEEGLSWPVPTRLVGLDNATAVATGGIYNMILKRDGTVWAWGSNNKSDVFGDAPERKSPMFDIREVVRVGNLTDVTQIAQGENFSVALKKDGTVWVWGGNQSGQFGNGTFDDDFHNTPALVPGLTEIVSISAGGGHTLALKHDGTVWAWGMNGKGQLGNGTVVNDTDLGKGLPAQVAGLDNVTAISAGGEFSMALVELSR